MVVAGGTRDEVSTVLGIKGVEFFDVHTGKPLHITHQHITGDTDSVGAHGGLQFGGTDAMKAELADAAERMKKEKSSISLRCYSHQKPLDTTGSRS